MTQLDNNTPYIYIITRRDLTLPQRAVQCSHAAIEAAKAFYDPQTLDHPHLVLSEVRSEYHLSKLIDKLTKENVRLVIWREPDINHEITAIATEPIFNEKRKLFKKLQLIKGEKND